MDVARVVKEDDDALEAADEAGGDAVPEPGTA
jgi:hypothetical protein